MTYKITSALGNNMTVHLVC